MTFIRATAKTLWKHEEEVVAPMSATADPAFEVATIKPSRPDAKGQAYRLRTRHFAAANRTVEDLIRFSYKLRTRQISGLPAWAREDKFDIAAEPDGEGLPDEDQYRLMIRKLLADRFQIANHSVQQVFPVYGLIVEKSPPNLVRTAPDFNGRGEIYVKAEPGGESAIQFAGHTMAGFADVLMNFIEDRQIVDETGLQGLFDFKFRLPTNLTTGPPTGVDDEPISGFFIAVQSLGLKLVPQKVPIEVLVIDRVEKPSAN